MIDLTAFCSRDPFRTNLARPFTIGVWTYAATGHIAIRVPRRDDVPENPEAPKAIVSLFEPGDRLSYAPLSVALPEPKNIRCAACRGRGHGDACGECHGTGEHQCDCEHCQERCGGCGGTGITFSAGTIEENERKVCDECEGFGVLPDERIVAFPQGLGMKMRYLRAVLSLPGPTEMGIRVLHGYPSDGPVEHPAQFFRGPGWAAIVMPYRLFTGTPVDLIVYWPPVEAADRLQPV